MAKQVKKPAQSLTEVKRIAQQEAQALGIELVDVAIVRENSSRVLMYTIDKDCRDGVSLDDCEAFHRRVLNSADGIDYDYMAVSSPGADRPLKRQRDFERALGQRVDVHFYRQMQGAKQVLGRLAAFDEDSVTLETGSGEICLNRADIALIKLALDDDELSSPLFDELERQDAQQSDTDDTNNTSDGGHTSI